MNIVYKIVLKRTEIPNTYIGSKSNCSVVDGKIYDRTGREYFGSSTDKSYKSLCEELGYDLEVLEICNGSYKDLVLTESRFQIEEDVVLSPRYFNKSIAAISTYADPNYATMRHKDTGKVARIPKDHPDIKSGVWVGLTRGRTIPEHEKGIRARFGKDNGFYGRTHSAETLKKLSENAKGNDWWYKRSPESRQSTIDAAKRSKSEEQKKKMSESGKDYIMLQNKLTLEIIRVKRTDPRSNNSEWVNPKKITPEKRYTCNVCGIETTNGNIKRWHNEKCKHKKS